MFVRHALDEANLQANIKYYTEHSPDRRNRSEVLYAARLAKVSIILSAIEGNSNFVDKQLSGLAQLPMPIGDILSQSWSGLAKQLSRQLYFFGAGNRVLVYDEGALMEKEGNDELVPLVLPVAGFAHQANVTLFDPYETQFTVMWFEDSSEDAATVLSSLIQLALASQSHHETPHLVEVDVTSEGNNPTAIVLSSDHLSQLCKLSEEDPTDHSIEFKKAVLTSHQQSGILKTAGKIILTDCIFGDDGQEIVQELMLGARDLVLYELTLRGNLPFGIEQCLQLIESCNKTIVIGSGAATEFFEQAHLVDRLKDKAAIGGIYYSWKFDATDYSSFEMKQLGEFLVDIYSRKLLWSVDSTAFAVAKAQILERLSNAYDQHDPDGETFEWPCDLVDILPRTQNQESLANDVKEHLEPLVFVEGHRPLAIPIPPRPDAETVPLSVYFASQMDAGKRKCILCATDIGIDDTQCEVCLCICMPGQVGTNCEACRKSNEANDGAIPEQNPVGVLDPAPKNNEADDDTIPEQAKLVVGEGGFSIEATASSSAKVRNSIFSEAAPSSSTNDLSSGGGWSFTDAIESASNGDTPALVKETEPVVGEKKTEEPETKGVEPPQVQASKTPKIEPVVEEKKTDEPKTKGVEPPQVQASETPKIERKLQANDRVQVNDLVHAGSKRQHVGKHGTVQTLRGPWVYVKLDGEEELIAFYPVWLD